MEPLEQDRLLSPEINAADVESRGYPDASALCKGEEESVYPYLADELHAVERRLAAGRPILGVCLGAQLIARSAGKKVAVGLLDAPGSCTRIDKMGGDLGKR